MRRIETENGRALVGYVRDKISGLADSDEVEFASAVVLPLTAASVQRTIEIANQKAADAEMPAAPATEPAVEVKSKRK